MTDESTDTNPFPEWLEEVAIDPLIVDQSKDGLSYECHGNCWSFSISQSQADTTTMDDVLAFLSRIMQAREQQIKARPEAVNPMLFYCWFDEQASQLRFSLVSASHECLPFGAIVEETDDFARVVNLFLSSQYHNGVPLAEFMTEEETAKRNAPEPPPHVLLVAAKALPTK